MGAICLMACTHCKGRLGVRLAPWISCLPTTIPDQYLVTRRQRNDQNGYLCSVSLYICLLYLIVLFMNAVLCLWLTRGARSEELLSRTEMGCSRGSTRQRETLGALVCTGRYIGMCRACLFLYRDWCARMRSAYPECPDPNLSSHSGQDAGCRR